MALIGQLYYQKGECLGKLEYDGAEVEDAYKKASFFFDILEMHSYKEALVNKISR